MQNNNLTTKNPQSESINFSVESMSTHNILNNNDVNNGFSTRQARRIANTPFMSTDLRSCPPVLPNYSNLNSKSAYVDYSNIPDISQRNMYEPSRQTPIVSPWNNSYEPSRQTSMVSQWNKSAAKSMDYSTKEMFKKFNAECDIRSAIKKTSLFDKLLSDKVDNIVDFLTTSNTDPNSTDFWGNNILIALSLNNKVANLEEIMNASTNCFSNETLYNFFIHLASSEYLTYSETTRVKLIKTLLWKVGDSIVNKQDDYGNTVITHCLNSEQILESFLTEKSVDLELTNLCGNTSVSYCIQNSSNDSLEKLIGFMKQHYTKEKTQRILNLKNLLGDSPLILAIKNGNIQIVKTLLNTGLIDVNTKTFDGKTSLLLAIEKNMQDVCTILLESGNIDINASDNLGSIPIMKAIELNHYKTIFALLSKNVCLSHKNSIDRTPLLQSLLLKYKSPKILENPISRIIEGFSGFQSFAHAETSTCFDPLFDEDSNSFATPASFMKLAKMDSSVKTSSQLYDVILSKLIQQCGSNINTSDLQGNMAFMLICDNNDTLLFDLMMANPSFDPKIKNVKGVSSYEYIKTKYETMLCQMFGSESYCPVNKVALSNSNANTCTNILDDTEFFEPDDLNFDSIANGNNIDNFSDSDCTTCSGCSKCGSENKCENIAEPKSDPNFDILSALTDTKFITQISEIFLNSKNITPGLQELCNKINAATLVQKQEHIQQNKISNKYIDSHVCQHGHNRAIYSDVGSQHCVPHCMTHYNSTNYVDDIQIKKFGVLKYFYEKVSEKMTQ